MYYLYKITNGKNSKVYIGQTNNPDGRWKNHKAQSKSLNPPQYIHRAMNKYGIDNFIFEVILVCQSRENAGYAEIDLIVQYNSRNKENGYNLASGGYCDPMTEKRQLALLEGGKRWRESFKEQNLPIPGGYQKGHEQLPNEGSFKKGHKTTHINGWHENDGSFKEGSVPWNKGKSHSEETKRKISETLKNRKK